METLHNQKVYKCSYCSRVSLNAGGIHRHEISCKKNPNIKLLCPWCKHIERVETIGEEGSKCEHCYNQTICDDYGYHGGCDNRDVVIDFVCKKDNVKMYSAHKVARMEHNLKQIIINRCDRPMKNFVEGCENYENAYKEI